MMKKGFLFFAIKFSILKIYVQTQLAVDVDNAVYALDASVIDLTLSLCPWVKFRKTKGGIKLHIMLDLRGNIPAFLTITDGKVHDVRFTAECGTSLVPVYLKGFLKLYSRANPGFHFCRLEAEVLKPIPVNNIKDAMDQWFNVMKENNDEEFQIG